MYYASETVKKIQNSKHLLIYGARIVAKEVAGCLMGAPYFCKIDSFVVTDMEGNPENLLGVSVIDYREAKKRYPDALVLVAVMEKYAAEIAELLKSEGFYNVIFLTFECDLWSLIRGNYYRELRLSEGKEYPTLEEELQTVEGAEKSGKDAQGVHIYRAQCHVDRKLDVDFSKYDWEIPIQVGAALTDMRIAAVCDNQGDNISHKNKQFCELTALYWIWKNDTSKYAGLCHYRRHFLLNEELIERLATSDIDVVLTIPILNFPSVKDAYVSDHIEGDWDTMLQAIEVLQPDYYETAQEIQQGKFYCAYNMFIARKEIFDAYCEWLFPILFYCEEKCGMKEDKYQNRYIGFLAERLLTIYFMHHDNDYKIVYAQKEFCE